MHNQRHYPVGAEFTNGGVHFRVWAPAVKKIHVVIANNPKKFEMTEEQDGYKSLAIPSAKPGDL